MKDHSFTVDMEPFSRVTGKDYTFTSDTNNRLSTKGSQLVDEKKMNRNCQMNIDGNREVITSPKGSLVADMIPGKSISINNPHVNCKITIVTGGTTTTTKVAGTPNKSCFSGRRLGGFKRSSIIKPRGILFFFATLFEFGRSSMGTILLICLTLSAGNYDADVHC